MNPEEHDLRQLGEDLAAALHSPWEPRCVARAFATPTEGALTLTMQGWIDLDAALSPLLAGRLPETLEDIHAAVEAFRCGPVEFSANEAAGVGLLMLEALDEAFGMALRMRLPSGPSHSAPRRSGLGDWLPILAALVAQLGLGREEALATPVGQAFALLAADKLNRGWKPDGEPYALREVAAAEKEEARV